MLKNQVFFKRCAVAASTLSLVWGVAGCGGGGDSGNGPGSGGATNSTPVQDRFFATVSAMTVASPEDGEAKDIDSITVTTPQDEEPSELDS